MSTAVPNGRRPVVGPVLVGRGNLNLLAIIPIWIASAVIHGALLAVAFFVFNMFEGTAKGGDAPPQPTATTEVEDVKPEPDLTNTDIGIDDTIKLNYDLDKIDAAARRLDLLVDDGELAERRKAWKPRPPRHRAGALAKYAKLVGQAPGGAVTHDGAAEWPWFDQ